MPAFFDTSARGALDDRIIAEQLPPKCGPRVVIAGHTHAARDIRLDAERVYLNTGTWTELLDLADFADTDAGLKRLIDRLDGRTPRAPPPALGRGHQRRPAPARVPVARQSSRDRAM